MITPELLKARTKKFAIDVILAVEDLPYKTSTNIMTKQLIRAATSVGANYRSACRARSKADFISKINIVEEEADECCYWLELLFELNGIELKVFNKLHKEAEELTAIFTASGKTSKSNK
jgi:four helix bundle protein